MKDNSIRSQEKLNITLIQTDIEWMDSKSNLNFLESQIQNIKTDLIVLPEMFNTGFCMQPSAIAETMQGQTVQWMLQKSKALNAAICGSLCVKEEEEYYNRFVWVEPSGKTVYYNKKHLFSYGGEQDVFEAGNVRVTISYKGYVIRPFVCYDLRFPVWSRNTHLYDIAIYVANWPAKRAFAWNALLTARAIENMCYVVAVNRLGIDGNKLHYQGDSQVIGPLGELITQCENLPIMRQLVIDKQTLEKARSQFKFLEDRDNFELK
ncbi:amidohydrolase [Ochrovirga pacifica]|uniref:amidohydrolase n=1 Tax=Ochrovirga pacifica TaxID=1042376 RepID=UPI0002558ABD|nr:amidohydrolase [Ochrovirga pacifica]